MELTADAGAALPGAPPSLGENCELPGGPGLAEAPIDDLISSLG